MLQLPNDFGSLRLTAPGHRPTERGFRALDVHALKRTGILEPTRYGRMIVHRWDDGGVIGVRREPDVDAITLSYQSRKPGGEWQQHSDTVALDSTRCNYGGTRPWFRCPGCGRRVGKLYGGALFRCRHCCGFAYESTRMSEVDRLLERAQAIRIALGGTGNLFDVFPPKPRGMHGRTYQRLRDESLDAGAAALRTAVGALSGRSSTAR